MTTRTDPSTVTAPPGAVTDAAADAGDRTLDALPVVLELAGGEAGRVAAWVEGVLGWQPVTGDGVGLAPRVRLLDTAAASRATGVGARPEAEPPTVLLVAPGDEPAVVAEVAVRVRPAAALAWPDARAELAGRVGRLLARSAPHAADGAELRVGGACGGVGTTTVSLALAALTAWGVGPVLAVTHGDVPVTLPRTVAVEGLAGPRAWSDAVAVPGVPGLRVVRADGPAPGVVVDAQGAAVVRDLGVRDEVDVLCVRRDAAGVAAVERSSAAAIVVVDDGLVPPAVVRGAAAGRRLVTLPRSTRVARAGVLRQVPAALPGSYLRLLAPLLGDAPRRPAGPPAGGAAAPVGGRR